MSDENWDALEFFDVPHEMRTSEERENVVAAFYAGREAMVAHIVERLRAVTWYRPECGPMADLVEQEWGSDSVRARSS